MRRDFRRGLPRSTRGQPEQPETTAIGEASFTRDDDAREIFAGAPPDKNRGEGGPAPWRNRYTQSNTPFIAGTTSTRVLPANSRRAYLIIQNKSVDVMYVNFGQLADIYNGIQISAGGAYEWIGGGEGGSFVPGDDIYILGGSADLPGVASEGMLSGN